MSTSALTNVPPPNFSVLTMGLPPKLPPMAKPSSLQFPMMHPNSSWARSL
jgi:hypothetical protein